MFTKEYVFYGKHADYVKALTTKISEQDKTCIFERNVDVLLFAGLIGFVYGRKAKRDKAGNVNSEIKNTKIFTDTMIKESNHLMYNYEIIMLLHNKEIDDIEIRLDRAFRYRNKGEEFKNECKDIFNEYVLGGVEILHERILKDAISSEEYLNNLYEFIEEFNMKYNTNEDEYSEEELGELSKYLN